MRTVFVTGGAGYIGAHVCKAFSYAGWNIIVFDNLTRGWRDAVKWGLLIEGDVNDALALRQAFNHYRPDLVVHLAAFAYIEESFLQPDIYFRNNIGGTLTLLGEMRRAEINLLIFSSTCASYGLPVFTPIDESHPQKPINPYGRSKLVAEQMIADFAHAFDLKYVVLRYFNAAGCDAAAEIGERHIPEPHVIPKAIAAALSGNSSFVINGADLLTYDGTPIRDYIHVTDLAAAHLSAAEFLLKEGENHIFNLGTGVGTSVLEVLTAIQTICEVPIEIKSGPARLGDPPVLVASAAKAKKLLAWTSPNSSIEEIVETAVRWYRREQGVST